MSKKPTDKYQQLRNTGKLHGTIKRAREVRKTRDEQQAISPARPSVVRITLGPNTAAMVMQTARESRPRVQNWVSPQATTDLSMRCVHVRDMPQGRYSSQCRYIRYEYCGVIRSAGRHTPRRLLWFVGQHHGTVIAGRGWRFGRDQLGLYVERSSNKDRTHRYHVEADDCLAGWTQIHSNAMQHIELQKQMKRKKHSSPVRTLIKQAARLGLHVHEADSVAAGNCRAGTREFARQHQLRDLVDIRVLQLLAITATGTLQHQIRRTIEHAARRCQTDLERGYCLVTR